jgi:integrase
MTTTTPALRQQATKLCTGADLKTAKPGDKLRFGGGLYALVSPQRTISWQVHYHVAGRHQATIVGRWPDLGISEAKAKREEIRRTIREGGDPAIDRREQRTARLEADAATVRTVAERWLVVAPGSRAWSATYRRDIEIRLAKHILPAIGDRPIGRVTTHEIEALVVGMVERFRSQAVHVRNTLQLLFDYAAGHDLVTVNPVRKIRANLPKRVVGDPAEVSRAHVGTIEDARAVLAAMEAIPCSPFFKLAHRLIALTAVRKVEGVEAQWSEVSEGPDGMTWTIPAERMKGRRGKKREHVIPLAPQAADVFRAARTLAASLGIESPVVFPGRGNRNSLGRGGLNDVLSLALPAVGMVGRHTIHGWRTTFYTVMKETDYRDETTIDAMLAHTPMRPSQAAIHYDSSRLIRNGIHLQPLLDRRRIATAWADQLLIGAPSAFALAGLVEPSNVVQLREAA